MRSPGLAVLAFLLAAPLALAQGDRTERFEALHDAGPAQVLRLDERAEIRVYREDVEVPPAFMEALERALDDLEPVFGPLSAPLRIQIGGPSSSLAIAYNPGEDQVLFPVSPELIGRGLEDMDRLRHEVFHAYLGRTHPELVSPEALKSGETRALHEGAADFFAWLADENEVFGDNYFRTPRTYRVYRTTLLYPLSQGSHARGGALTAYWIREDMDLEELARRIREGCAEAACMVREEDRQAFGLDPKTRPEIRVRVVGHEVSRKNRYRVRPGDVLELEGNGALQERFPILDTAFTGADGGPPAHFTFEELPGDPGLRRFRILLEPDAQPEKLILRHLADGVVVGFDVLYLSRTRKPKAQG